MDIDKINSLKILSTTRVLYLDEAPEAFEVVAYDETGMYCIHFLILNWFK